MAIKQVFATFIVDTGANGDDWDKHDIATALASKFKDNDATVWDSLVDFLADFTDGHIPDRRGP